MAICAAVIALQALNLFVNVAVKGMVGGPTDNITPQQRYCVSGVGPLYHTARGVVTSGDWRWLWHWPACVASLLGTLWAYYTNWRNPDAKKLVADLQPPQNLLDDPKD